MLKPYLRDQAKVISFTSPEIQISTVEKYQRTEKLEEREVFILTICRLEKTL